MSNNVNLKRRLVRPRNNRVIAGVAQGMADYLNVDVVLVRVIWLLLLVPGGLPGIIPYLIFWAVMPEAN